MNKRGFDLMLFLVTISVFLVWIGTSFFDYDPTTFLLTMIMIFCWDIGDTLRRIYKKMKGE
jgi:hypothetical protein